MNAKLILLLVGLLVGGALGWLTTPTPVDINIGPVSVEVQGGGEGGTVTATGNDGQLQVQVGQPSLLDGRATRTAIFAIIGAIAGLAVGYVADRRQD